MLLSLQEPRNTFLTIFPKAIRELQPLAAESALQFSQLGQRVFQKIADAQQLTIAAINGYCIGGALDLALACDVRVASTNAVFAHPGARLGIITGWGGTQRLPRIVGRMRSLELFASARKIGSAEALLNRSRCRRKRSGPGLCNDNFSASMPLCSHPSGLRDLPSVFGFLEVNQFFGFF